MSAPCPKCGYRRRDGEIAPDWQCPSCGMAYAKFGSAPAPDGDDASNDVDRGNSGKTLSFDTVLTVSVATGGVLLLIRAMTGGARSGIRPDGDPFPAVFCLCRVLYLW